MSRYIKVIADEAVIGIMIGGVHTAREYFRDFTVNLTESEKNGCPMAERCEGYARLIASIAREHIHVLSRTKNLRELTSALDYDNALESVRQATLALLEQVNETQIANALDIMSMIDCYAASLEAARRNNAALDLLLREADEWNKRFGHRTAVKAPNPGEPDAQ